MIVHYIESATLLPLTATPITLHTLYIHRSMPPVDASGRCPPCVCPGGCRTPSARSGLRKAESYRMATGAVTALDVHIYIYTTTSATSSNGVHMSYRKRALICPSPLFIRGCMYVCEGGNIAGGCLAAGSKQDGSLYLTVIHSMQSSSYTQYRPPSPVQMPSPPLAILSGRNNTRIDRTWPMAVNAMAWIWEHQGAWMCLHFGMYNATNAMQNNDQIQ